MCTKKMFMKLSSKICPVNIQYFNTCVHYNYYHLTICEYFNYINEISSTYLLK